MMLPPLQLGEFTLAAVRPKGSFHGIVNSQRIGYLIVWSADVLAARPKRRHFISTIIGDLGNLVGSEYGYGNITPRSFLSPTEK